MGSAHLTLLFSQSLKMDQGCLCRDSFVIIGGAFILSCLITNCFRFLHPNDFILGFSLDLY